MTQEWITVADAQALRCNVRSWSGCCSGSGWLGVVHYIEGRRVGGTGTHVQNDSPTGYESPGERSYVSASQTPVAVGMTVDSISNSGNWEFPTQRRWKRVVVPNGWRPGKRPGKALRQFRRQWQRELDRQVAERELEHFRERARGARLPLCAWLEQRMDALPPFDRGRGVLKAAMEMA